MKTNRLLPWVVLLIAGVVLWTFAWHRSRLQAQELDRLRTVVAQSERRTNEIRSSHIPLGREIAEAGKPAPAPSALTPPSPTHPEVPRPTGRQPLIVSADGAVAESFVRAFDLTEAEVGVIRHAVAEARAQLTRLTVEHAQFAQGSRGSSREAVISIEPFVEAGMEVRIDLLKRFGEVLGAERYAIFVGHYSEGPLTTDMGNFGRGRRTVTITRFANGYTVMDAATIPGARNGGGGGRISPRSLADLKDRSFPELFAKFAQELEAIPLYSQP